MIRQIKYPGFMALAVPMIFFVKPAVAGNTNEEILKRFNALNNTVIKQQQEIKKLRQERNNQKRSIRPPAWERLKNRPKKEKRL